MRKGSDDQHKQTQQRLTRRFASLEEWLQHIPKAWFNDKKLPRGVPLKHQLQTHQPNTNRRLTPELLRDYLQGEKQQHQGARIVSIPLFIDQHWVVLTLHISQSNQIRAAAYTDSVVNDAKKENSERGPLTLNKDNPLYGIIQSVYSNFQRSIEQYQYRIGRDDTSLGKNSPMRSNPISTKGIIDELFKTTKPEILANQKNDLAFALQAASEDRLLSVDLLLEFHKKTAPERKAPVTDYQRGTLDEILTDYNREILLKRTPREKIRLIVTVVKKILRRHTFEDAILRIAVLDLLNFMLIKENIGFCSLKDRRQFMFNGLDESITAVLENLHSFGATVDIIAFCRDLREALGNGKEGDYEGFDESTRIAYARNQGGSKTQEDTLAYGELAAANNFNPEQMQKALRQTVKTLQDRYGQSPFAGSTLISAVIEGDKVHIVNLGSSVAYAVYVYDGYSVLERLNDLHNPNTSKELRRVRRQYEKYNIPGLRRATLDMIMEETADRNRLGNRGGSTIAVSRAIGDTAFEGVGLSHVPELSSRIIRALNPPDERIFIILAPGSLNDYIEVRTCSSRREASYRTEHKKRVAISSVIEKALGAADTEHNNPAQIITQALIDSATGTGCNENVSVMVTELKADDRNTKFMAVFDGHGGASVSKALAANYEKTLIAAVSCQPLVLENGNGKDGDYKGFHEPTGIAFAEAQGGREEQEDTLVYGELHAANNFNSKQMQKALLQTVKKLQDSCGQSPSVGSTLISAVIQGNDRVHIANVGDSAVYVVRVNTAGNVQLRRLNDLHNPDTPEELKRIRMQLQRQNPGYGALDLDRTMCEIEDYRRLSRTLAVSRAIGDTAYEKTGLSHVPELTSETINAQYSKGERVFILLGCDGLVDYIEAGTCSSSREASYRTDDEKQRAISSVIEKALGAADTEHNNPAQIITQALIESATGTGCGDNVSVMVTELKADDRNTKFMAVFDGHAGAGVSKALEVNYEETLIAAVTNQQKVATKGYSDNASVRPYRNPPGRSAPQNPVCLVTGDNLSGKADSLFTLGLRKKKGKEKVPLNEMDPEQELETQEIQTNFGHQSQ